MPASSGVTNAPNEYVTLTSSPRVCNHGFADWCGTGCKDKGGGEAHEASPSSLPGPGSRSLISSGFLRVKLQLSRSLKWVVARLP